MYYHLKAMWGGYWAGAIAVLAFSVVLAVNAGSLGFEMPERDAQKTVMVLTMNVFAALVFSAFAAEELEERVMRLLYACPVPAAYVMLEKIAICLILLMAGVSACAAAASGGDDWWPLMRAAVPASLFIGAVSAASSMIGRNVLAGLGAGIGYWSVELLTYGRWSGSLYLFQSIWPNERIDGGVNALLLCSAAGMLFGLVAVMVARGKQWLAKV